MSITLEAIKFNHDQNDFKSDALNLSRNGKELVKTPEWQRGVSNSHQDSPAAYAINETQGQTITIQAKFKSTSPINGPIEIRARELNDNLRTNEKSAPLLAKLFRPAVRRLTRGPLGDVGTKEVTFDSAGNTDFVDFVLPNVNLQERGVGASDVTWVWQCRTEGGNWTNIETSRHRIYTLLSQPHAPWKLQPENDSPLHLPWVEVLEYACCWANGAHDPVEAAKLITHSLYELGPERVKYAPSSSYIALGDPHFHCLTFLHDLGGRDKLILNCTDCAVVVSTLANALGCDLWQSMMTGFKYNPILRIGEPEPRSQERFDIHEVAWEYPCGAENDVYDACLQVDGNRCTPNDFDMPILPTDMNFGLYRGLLMFSPIPHGNGEPDQSTRKRRPLASETLSLLQRTDVKLFDLAVRTFNLEAWQEWGAKPATRLFFWHYNPRVSVPPDWTLRFVEASTTTEQTVLLLTRWQVADDKSAAVIRLNVYQGTSTKDALERLIISLASLHSFAGVVRGPRDLGDISFLLPQSDDVIFVRANLVIWVQSTGENISLEATARQIDEALIGPPRREDFIGTQTMWRFTLAEQGELTGERIRLEVVDNDPLEGLPLVYKFVSDTGVVFSENGQLSYRSMSAEPTQELHIFAINPHGRALYQPLQFNLQ